jgi:DNA-binding MarR family transcriptional regulator
LQDEHADLTVRQAMCLLLVATSPGITLRDLYGRLNYEHPSLASRQVSLLAGVGSRYKDSGLDLVKIEEDPSDRRQRVLHLTPKGRRLMADIVRELEGRAH